MAAEVYEFPSSAPERVIEYAAPVSPVSPDSPDNLLAAGSPAPEVLSHEQAAARVAAGQPFGRAAGRCRAGCLQRLACMSCGRATICRNAQDRPLCAACWVCAHEAAAKAVLEAQRAAAEDFRRGGASAVAAPEIPAGAQFHAGLDIYRPAQAVGLPCTTCGESTAWRSAKTHQPRCTVCAAAPGGAR